MANTIVKPGALNLGYKPHEAQQKVHDSGAKGKWLQCARRWGKDRACFGEMMDAYRISLSRTAEHINRYALVPPGFHAWIVVPNFPQGEQVWDELLALLPKAYIREVHRDEMSIYLNGQASDIWGKLQVKSAHDPAGLQTVGLDFLWVMEAQDIHDEAMHRFSPLLTNPGRMGRSIYNGIPPLWPDHWFQRGFEAAKRKRSADHAAFHFTIYDNPLLTEQDLEEIEGQKEIMTQDAWERMYMAKFSRNAGYFKNIDACISGDLLSEPMPGHQYVAGLDIGIARDFTVMDVLDADSRELVYRRAWDSTPWTDISHHIADIHSHWGVQILGMDATGMGGQAFADELSNMNLNVDPIQIVGGMRGDLLTNLVIALERETVHFPNVPILVRQLRAFQYKKFPNRAGGKAEAPAGEHDDEVWALALALHECGEPIAVLADTTTRRHTSRYIPTQAEVNGGSGRMSLGRRMMKERKHDKMKARMERAGMEV